MLRPNSRNIFSRLCPQNFVQKWEELSIGNYFFDPYFLVGRGLLSKKVCTIPAGTWSLSGKFTVFVNNSLVFNFDVMKECFESAIASKTGFTDLDFG